MERGNHKPTSLNAWGCGLTSYFTILFIALAIAIATQGGH